VDVAARSVALELLTAAGAAARVARATEAIGAGAPENVTGVAVGVAGTSVNVGTGGRGTTVDVQVGVDPPVLRDILHLPDRLLGGIAP